MSKHCTACEELKKNAPHFILNGITERECESLKNDTGLNGLNNDSSGGGGSQGGGGGDLGEPAIQDITGLNNELSTLRNNCEDLNDMLDCLVGALHEELPAYDVCNIKDYIDKLMTNLYNLQKAIICSKCGQWTKLWEFDDQIRLLWAETRRLDQRITDLRSEMLRLLTELETRVNNRMDRLIQEAETRINNRITEIETTVNANNRALQLIVNNLRNSGAWTGTATTPISPPVNIGGNFVADRNFATGNINLFGNAAGNRFIRTNSSNNNPQDIRGGLT